MVEEILGFVQKDKAEFTESKWAFFSQGKCKILQTSGLYYTIPPKSRMVEEILGFVKWGKAEFTESKWAFFSQGKCKILQTSGLYYTIPPLKVVWLRKFWASCSEVKRSLLEVNEHLTHKGSAKFTNQTAFYLWVEADKHNNQRHRHYVSQQEIEHTENLGAASSIISNLLLNSLLG